MARNLYHGLLTATHPCYRFGTGGYECKCGQVSQNKRAHNKHVRAVHDAQFASEVLSSQDYEKLYSEEERSTVQIEE